MDCVNEWWARKEEQLDTLSNKQKDNELVLVWTYENGPASQGYKSGNYRILAIVPEHSDDYRILVVVPKHSDSYRILVIVIVMPFVYRC